MYYEIYIDVFFLINFMMDYLLLAAVCRMLSMEFKRRRVLLGALMGAVSYLSCDYNPDRRDRASDSVSFDSEFSYGYDRTWCEVCPGAHEGFADALRGRILAWRYF